MSWRDKVQKEMNENEGVPFLNLSSGESIELTFMDEGQEKRDEKFKRDMIEFLVSTDKGIMKWDISTKAYSVLNILMSFDSLKGRKGILKRTGEGLETKWSFTPTPEKGE